MPRLSLVGQLDFTKKWRKTLKSFETLFSRIVNSPVLWGSTLCVVFYMAISRQEWDFPLIERYFASHPVEYIITFMFLVGMASLVQKLIDILRQESLLRKGPLLESSGKIGDPESSQSFLETLKELPEVRRHDYHPSRLRNILAYVQRTGSTEGVEHEMRYLSDDDALQAESSYGLVRMIIWAIPILGFLGTVIGIALAMGNLSPEDLEKSLPTVMAGLTIAFDTTALALALSIVLYFSQFFTFRQESQLLQKVDRLVTQEMAGRFEPSCDESNQGQLTAVRKMLEAVIDSLEALTEHQSDIWKQAMRASNSRYAKMASECAGQLKTSLSESLKENLHHHAQALVESEQELMERHRKELDGMYDSVNENVTALKELQNGMVRQTEVLGKVFDATGQITMLEDRLNQNLASLAGAKHFEETVNSLAAAIHLLNNRLEHQGGDYSSVRLEEDQSGKGHAA